MPSIFSPLVLAGLVVAAMVVLVVPSANAADGGSWTNTLWGGVTGSGKLVDEARQVAGFQAIELAGNLKLVLRQGAREGLALHGDDNVLPLIETRVVDRRGVPTLEIGTRRGERYTTKTPVLVTVDLITLKALQVAGRGEVVCDALKTAALRLEVAGSTELRIDQLETDRLSADIAGRAGMHFSGRASQVALSMSGSGDVQARALESDDVTVDIAGKGDAVVTARKTLTVSVAGKGSVSYVGDAVVKSSIAGMGSVKKL